MPVRESLATTEEVAKYLRTTPAALHNMRWRGCAPRAVKRGRRLLWSWADVDMWLAEQADQQTRGGAA